MLMMMCVDRGFDGLMDRFDATRNGQGHGEAEAARRRGMEFHQNNAATAMPRPRPVCGARHGCIT